MDAFLALHDAARTLLCEEAGARLNITAAAVEKDLWVCFALRELFSLDTLGPGLTFKGGTSLSKGWKLIDRFSEDIDVVAHRELFGGGGALTKKQLKKLRKSCQAWIRDVLQPSLDETLRLKLGMTEPWSLRLATIEEDTDQETLFFAYPSLGFASDYMQPSVRIELGARSETEPAEMPLVGPILGELFPEQMGLSQFVLRTIAPRRTFWEKAFLLHEESFRPAGRQRPLRLSRHYYDLWSLIERGIAAAAVADAGLFERVATHREAFWGQTWVDYSCHRRGALRLVPADDQVAGWKRDYLAMREMFFAEPPSFERVLGVVSEFEREFNDPRYLNRCASGTLRSGQINGEPPHLPASRTVPGSRSADEGAARSARSSRL